VGTQIGFFLVTEDGDLREFGRTLSRLGTALITGLTDQPAAQFAGTASDEPPTRDLQDRSAVADTPPPDLVVAVHRWLEIEFDERFAPEANTIRAYLVELARNPPSPGVRISYRESRERLGLNEAEHPLTSTAWPTVLRRFTTEAKRPLLKKVGSPLHRAEKGLTRTPPTSLTPSRRQRCARRSDLRNPIACRK